MVEIEKKLYSDIKEYCKINGLVIKDFINSLLKKSFTIEKYGETPFQMDNKIKAVLPTVHDTPEPIMNTFETKEKEKEKENEKKYYSEITMGNIKEAAKEIQKQTEKNTKKRKL